MKKPTSKRWIVIASVLGALVGGILLSGCEGESVFEDVTCTMDNGATYNCSEGEYGCGGDAYNCNEEGDCMACFENDCLGGCANCISNCTDSCVDANCNTGDCTGVGGVTLEEGRDYTIVGDLQVLSFDGTTFQCRYRINLNFDVKKYRRYDVKFALRQKSHFDKYASFTDIVQGDDRYTSFNYDVDFEITISESLQGWVSSASDVYLDLVDIRAY